MKKFIIVEVDGILRTPINKKGKAERYDDPKLFDELKIAEAWVLKHSYRHMSFHYEIQEVEV